MIDFSELKDGTIFEQLCRELLIRYNFDVHWTGVGQDSGKDLILQETVSGVLAPFKRTWLVNCKHNAKSGKAVGRDDIPNIVDDCMAANANGFLLICSTHPSASLVSRLQDIEKTKI
ncbi:restriction endonuclease [Legionella tunisiensis]|uniref:restriction endonuclease n=1 Tax=Legionella tunisiensis TaxID=1034944 RepID=UPI00036870BB|nr:restriction endonuclease [Legionella tunisiensis]